MVSMTKDNNITLVGMPGAGKSTLGVVLAKRRGMAFCDTDLLLQEGAGQLLSETIAERGIDGFQEYENYVLRGLECENTVIATGGSAVYGAEAMKHLQSIGRIVFVEVSFEAMQRRLNSDLEQRGVTIRPGMTLADLYAERQPLYELWADITIDTSKLSTREAVEALDELLG